MAALRMRSAALSGSLLVSSVLFLVNSRAFLVGPSCTAKAADARVLDQPTPAVSSAVLLASLPEPAHAGGMFDFGLTLPFVAVTFLTMMAVLNALWYGPVTSEMDDRNTKLLQTLSEATDMLTKADEIQVEYTEQIRMAREKASKAVAEYRQTTENAVAAQIRSASADRELKANEVKAKLEADVEAKMQAAEAEIELRKAEFVKETLAAVSL
eukprot:CAMPEP_0179036330 /NCGR_PEP_ID=MMETSP0796-20121207/13563_1 /TAXON_ID=73915 /ORGANISM="Pyrodinium bahamense, Strain pbaha01" /LENGTH=211 /DNA_ID=CAMNT_0020732615 /DNA_START=62 /DNA_END=697 /DNA_ORIENTATION=+